MVEAEHVLCSFQEMGQDVGCQVLPDDWATTANVMMETGRRVLAVSSEKRKEDKETWWYSKKVAY